MRDSRIGGVDAWWDFLTWGSLVDSRSSSPLLFPAALNLVSLRRRQKPSRQAHEIGREPAQDAIQNADCEIYNCVNQVAGRPVAQARKPGSRQVTPTRQARAPGFPGCSDPMTKLLAKHPAQHARSLSIDRPVIGPSAPPPATPLPVISQASCFFIAEHLAVRWSLWRDGSRRNPQPSSHPAITMGPVRGIGSTPAPLLTAPLFSAEMWVIFNCRVARVFPHSRAARRSKRNRSYRYGGLNRAPGGFRDDRGTQHRVLPGAMLSGLFGTLEVYDICCQRKES